MICKYSIHSIYFELSNFNSHQLLKLFLIREIIPNSEMSVQEEVLLFLEREFFFTWYLCSPKLCTCHHIDLGPLRAPWLWCSLDPLYYASVPVLYLCPHSLLCEFFEQLIASVEKKIRTCWIFLILQPTYHVTEKI